MIHKSILFADDNSHIREFCKQALADEGYCVVLARDADEAVRTAMIVYFDLIVLDLRMPIGGGFEAARQIKAKCPWIPIIFFTSQGADRLPADHRELAAACVAKSEDLTELKQVVARLLTYCKEHGPGTRSPPAATFAND
jgi:CheY-like chemotaxis protein